MLTDVIAALMMLLAFYKLAYLNKAFSYGFIFSSIFAFFSVIEFASEAMRMFSLVSLGSTFISVIGMARYLIIAITTVSMLLGMRDIAKEVQLNALSVRCHKGVILTFIIYALNIIWQTSALIDLVPSVKFMAISGYLIILATLILVILNLVSIYGCYMHICMPSRERARETKTSRFAFVNSFKRHEDEKRKEYADYKLEKLKARMEKIQSKENKK